MAINTWYVNIGQQFLNLKMQPTCTCVLYHLTQCILLPNPHSNMRKECLSVICTFVNMPSRLSCVSWIDSWMHNNLSEYILQNIHLPDPVTCAKVLEMTSKVLQIHLGINCAQGSISWNFLSPTNVKSSWNPCLWLADSKFVGENHRQDSSWNASQ